MQRYALELLKGYDEREGAESLMEQVKLALVSHDPREYISTILPDLKREDEEDDIDEYEDLDDTEGIWDFSQSSISPEEAMQVLSAVQSNIPEVSDLARFEGTATEPTKPQPNYPDEDALYDEG